MFFDRKDDSKQSAQQKNLSELFQTIANKNSNQAIPSQLVSTMDDYLLSPDEYVKKHIKNSNLIAQYCLQLFNDKKQNGVSCALNAVSKNERLGLLAKWRESYPLLQAYYSARENNYTKIENEWKNVDVDLVKNAVEKNCHESKTSEIPSSLLHALLLKLKFEELKIIEDEQPEGLPIPQERENKASCVVAEIQNLLKKSTLHLNLRGEFIFLKISELDLSTLDFTGTVFLGHSTSYCSNDNLPQIFYQSNLESSDFTNSQLRSIEMTNSNLRKAKFVNAEFSKSVIYFDAIDNPNNCVLAIGADFRKAIMNENMKKDIKSWVTAILNSLTLNLDNPWGSLFNEVKSPTSDDVITMLWLMGSSTVEELQDQISTITKDEFTLLSPTFRRALQEYCKDEDLAQEVTFHFMS